MRVIVDVIKPNLFGNKKEKAIIAEIDAEIYSDVFHVFIGEEIYTFDLADVKQALEGE
jgi:hypothetical protein